MMDKSKLYGLTHDLDGTPRTHQVRMLKVGIGYPRGPAIHVYIDRSGKWVVELGVGDKVALKRFDDRGTAKEYYTDQRRRAPIRKYPGKFPYFTFYQIGMDAQYYPDWDAIEQHGSIPTEIEVVFLTNDPLEQTMQWWTAAELKCEGNGKDARRRIELAETDDEKQAAAKAEAAGEQFFPLTNACYACGCKHARGDKAICKPKTRLSFQLAHAPTIGGTCVYETTGFRSGRNLFSCIEQIRTVTGRGDPEQGVVAGIPLILILRPYRTSHKGQPTKQYGVSLQLRAEDAVSLYRKAIQAGDEFQAISRVPRQLEAPEPEAAQAKRMEAEFYPEGDDQPEDSGEWNGQAAEAFEMPQRKSETAESELPSEEEMDRIMHEQLAKEAAQEAPSARAEAANAAPDKPIFGQPPRK